MIYTTFANNSYNISILETTTVLLDEVVVISLQWSSDTTLAYMSAALLHFIVQKDGASLETNKILWEHTPSSSILHEGLPRPHPTYHSETMASLQMSRTKW